VNAADEDVRARVEEIAGGADFVFVTVGDERAAEQGFAMLGAGGTLVVVGIPRSGSTLSVTIDPLVDGRRVLGSNMGSTNVAADIPRLAELYLAGRLLLDEMISGRYALEDVNEAIEEVRTGRVIRNVIVF
jgi:Zn-dependent alcohol dehydrogenase